MQRNKALQSKAATRAVEHERYVSKYSVNGQLARLRMKRSIKAALISGLAFPGLGHIYLKKYLVGAVLLFVAGASVYSVSLTVIDTALSVAKEIEVGEVSIDEEAIGRLIEQKSQSSAKVTNLSLVALMISWVIGVVDSYRVGRNNERTKGKVGEKET